MHRPIPITLVIFLGVCLFALNAMAQAPVETPDKRHFAPVEGEIAGTPFIWRVPVTARSASASFSTITPGVYSVRITAFADERLARADSIRLEFKLSQTEGRWSVREGSVHYFPFDASFPRFSLGPDHGIGAIEVQSFDPGTETGRLRLDLDATLFYHQSANTRPIRQRNRDLGLFIDLELNRI